MIPLVRLGIGESHIDVCLVSCKVHSEGGVCLWMIEDQSGRYLQNERAQKYGEAIRECAGAVYRKGTMDAVDRFFITCTSLASVVV
jgi:hypothetical protein